MVEEIIKIENVTKQYDQFLAVNDLSLTIKRGEIFGLLGPNGAGKTTTILMLLGLSEPTKGKVQVCGIDSTRYPIEVKRKVGYLPDDVGFYQHMTGLENLLYTAALNGIDRKEAENRAFQLLKEVQLLEAANKKVGKYSRGMRQRLGLADVLMKKPEVIILDEPTLGIDPEGVRDFLKLIKNLNQVDQMTVLLSSHHLHQVQQICDRVGIFVKGKLLAEGNMESLIKQLFLQDSYIIKVKASPIDQELIEKINSFHDVNRVEIDDHYVHIYCQKDVSAEIGKFIIESGVSLYHLSLKEYGLDEIYHRYFEGSESA